MSIPEQLYYTKDHEWIKIESDCMLVGITSFAQGELGDIVFMELPSIGQKISKGDSVGVIEAVKTVADLYAPLGGEIIDINMQLEEQPELINESPYDKGWIVKIKANDKISTEDYLTSDQYLELIGK